MCQKRVYFCARNWDVPKSGTRYTFVFLYQWLKSGTSQKQFCFCAKIKFIPKFGTSQKKLSFYPKSWHIPKFGTLSSQPLFVPIVFVTLPAAPAGPGCRIGRFWEEPDGFLKCDKNWDVPKTCVFLCQKLGCTKIWYTVHFYFFVPMIEIWYIPEKVIFLSQKLGCTNKKWSISLLF